ncbi:MAG: hypothetical protein ABIG68_12270, partial [Acidobacteriota bacterium]
MAATAMSALKRFALGLVLVSLGAGSVWLGVLAVRQLRLGNSGDAGALVAGCLLAACFACVIALVAWASGQVKESEAEVAAQRTASPDQPWMWRREWAERRIEHLVPRLGLAVLWGFAAVWNAAILGAAAMIHLARGLTTEPGVVVVLVIFGLAGVFLLTMAARATVHRLKYGRSILELRSLPGVLGGEFSGVLHAPQALAPDAELAVALDCIQRIHRAKGRDFIHLEWRVEKRVAGGGGGVVPVTLALPFNCPESTPDGSPDRARIEWKLRVSASTPGIDYAAVFEVPVFKTEASDPSRLRGAVDDADRALGEPPPTRIRIVPTASGGVSLVYPRPGWLTWWLAASVAPLSIAGLVAWLSHYNDMELLVALGIGAGISAAIFVVTLLGMVTHLSRIEILPDAVRIIRGMGGLGWSSQVARADVGELGFDLYRDGSKVAYTVELKTSAGASRTVATGLQTV